MEKNNCLQEEDHCLLGECCQISILFMSLLGMWGMGGAWRRLVCLDEEEKFHLVSWENVCSLFHLGELNFWIFGLFNKAAFGK